MIVTVGAASAWPCAPADGATDVVLVASLVEAEAVGCANCVDRDGCVDWEDCAGCLDCVC